MDDFQIGFLIETTYLVNLTLLTSLFIISLVSMNILTKILILLNSYLFYTVSNLNNRPTAIVNNGGSNDIGYCTRIQNQPDQDRGYGL